MEVQKIRNLLDNTENDIQSLQQKNGWLKTVNPTVTTQKMKN